MRVEQYLGVMVGLGGGGGALHKLTGDGTSSSIGQTICGSGSEELVNVPPSACQRTSELTAGATWRLNTHLPDVCDSCWFWDHSSFSTLWDAVNTAVLATGGNNRSIQIRTFKMLREKKATVSKRRGP